MVWIAVEIPEKFQKILTQQILKKYLYEKFSKYRV